MTKLYIFGIMFIAMLSGLKLHSQTPIAAGNISGVWTKQGSPYIIKGDINIPEGKKLQIKPGVIVKFKGSFIINVQGSLEAEGTANDSIVFTITDTNGYKKDSKIGWNGIHFDSRSIRWDTIHYSIPKDDEIRQVLADMVKSGNLDTTTRVLLNLQGEDLVNDDAISYVKRNSQQGSRLKYCRFEYGSAFQRSRPYIFGGAIYIYKYSNLAISNSIFENNRSYAGGAIYCKEAAPVFINNTFNKCYANSSGGAMVFILSGPILSGNKIIGNTSGYNGGGILFYESRPYVQGNIIIKNKATSTGGGIFIERQAERVLPYGDYSTNISTKIETSLNSMNTNLGNDVVENIISSNGRFLNNLICYNKAQNGGGVGLFSTAPEFTNNTICNNTAINTGGGFYFYFSAPVITNSIIYGNKAGLGSQMHFIQKNSLNISYCDLESGISGISKDTSCNLIITSSRIIKSNPIFNDPDKFDYSLMQGSPCIDAGKNDTSRLNLAKYDLKKKNRVNDNLIDLGAIEYVDSTMAEIKRVADSLAPINKIVNTDTNSTGDDIIYNIYPNPNEGNFSVVVYNNPYPELVIEVFNNSGRKIYSVKNDSGNLVEEYISLKSLIPGIYLVKLSANSKLVFHELIIIE